MYKGPRTEINIKEIVRSPLREWKEIASSS